jgi:hypothetical protein
MPSDPKPDEWAKRVTDKTAVRAIYELAKKHFPVGEIVKAEQHQRFQEEVYETLERGKS